MASSASSSMTTRARVHLIGLTVCALFLPGLPTSSARPADSARPAEHGKVTFSTSTWTVRDRHLRHTRVVVRYPGGDPDSDWDGHPVRLQLRTDDGDWRTIGHARQRPVPGEAESRTRIGYHLPARERIHLRVKALSETSSLTSHVRRMFIVAEPPAYDPTPLPHTGNVCSVPSIGRTPKRIAYECYGPGKYEWNKSWLYRGKSRDRRILARHAQWPQVATRPGIVLVQKQLDTNIYHEHGRARWYARGGRSGWVAYRRDGTRVRLAMNASLSANGRRIAYTSKAHGIAPHTPSGRNVYAARPGSRTSRYVGHGRECGISGSGRFVVWRAPDGMVWRRDLRSGHKIAVTAHPPDLPQTRDWGSPELSRNGRYVTFSIKLHGQKQVRFYDAKRDEIHTIAKGWSPTISADGRYVAYTGRYDADLYVWDRRHNTSELLTVGPSGHGTDQSVYLPDISPDGRWVVAVTYNGITAPDNGSGRHPRNDIVLFDRKARRAAPDRAGG